MFGKKGSADIEKTDTLLGDTCTITGDIVTKNSIRIDGNIIGNIQADGKVVIAEKGSIKGDVNCKEFIVYGAVEGVITTQRLHLQPSAKINGEINTKTLQVEEGAVYQGAVHMDSSKTDNTVKNDKLKIS